MSYFDKDSGLFRKLCRGQRGFAIVLALVVMSILFAAAGGLALSRQIWGFGSTKQLDKALLESAVLADSSLWFTNLRKLFENKWRSVTPGGYFGQEVSGLDVKGVSLNGTIAQSVSYVDGAPVPTNIFLPAPVYPQYPTNIEDEGVQFGIPSLFDLSKSPSNYNALPVSVSDPYYGSKSYLYGFGVLFSREMDAAANSTRYGGNKSDTTKLRAWYSVDGAGVTMVALRNMALSQFTFYSAEKPRVFSDFPDRFEQVPLTLSTSFLGNSTETYEYPAGSGVSSQYAASRVGIGRVYVDGTAVVSGELPLGFPLVVTKGFFKNSGETFSASSQQFRFYYGGNNTLGVGQSFSNFYEYLRWKGVLGGFMVSTSDLSPSRLLTGFGLNRGGGNLPLKEYIQKQSGMVLVGLRVQTDPVSGNQTVQVDLDPPNALSLTSSQLALMKSVWLYNPTSKELTFRPEPGFYDGFTANRWPIAYALSPTVYTVSLGGMPAVSQVKLDLSLLVEGVADLAVNNPEARRLTVMSFGPLYLSDNFNAANKDLGTMVMAPQIFVPGNSTISGVFITESPNPTTPFISSNGQFSPVTLKGGLVQWNWVRDPVGEMVLRVPVRLEADGGYLSGDKMPYTSIYATPGNTPTYWGPPVVVDLRVAQDTLELYKLQAVEDRGYKELEF